ncbi:C39 family peptidase [Peptostreptococcus faecalis]|uniref:C39 family peptidase n=1 Tax=Peptostreptococcus faecalis TaxID=2045015 RepID=UPI000C79ED81|nr:C39 family peptidase [Peptostreptococcus faecalis]
MDSSNRKNGTRYTFKGNKKSENKYADIYEDLNKKEKVYNSNSLKKIHKLPEGEEEPQSEIGKIVTRVLSAEEAEANAQKRRQAMKNEKQIATQKSSPIITQKRSVDFDREESIERLKREKRASKTGDEDLLYKTKRLDLRDIDKENEDTFSFEIADKTARFESVDESNVYEKSLNNDPSFIRKTAKERANMDKSGVEIYKEYSDFGTKRLNKNSTLLSSNSNSNEDEEQKYSLEDTLRNSKIKNEEDIRLRESEIEEIIRRRRQESQENRTSRKNKKTGFFNSSEKNENTSNSRRSTRADVYRRNNEKKSQKLNVKKVGTMIVIVFLVIIFGATAFDKIFSNKGKDNTAPKKTTTTTTSQPKQEEKKESVEEKIKKLNDIKSKLNSEESQKMDYIIENISSYPEKMIDLLIRNHETIDYVYSYKDKDKYNNKALVKNISSSYYVDGSVPLFLQWDRRWGYRDYGKEMIGLSACGPTSLAMVIKHFDSNADVNPYDVAKYAQDNGYVSAENTTSWKLFEKGLNNYGLESRDIVPTEAKMKRALDDGQILIASLKPGIFTEVGHIIVIKGYDRNGDFLINDPNSIINTNKSWSYDELKNDLRKIWGVSSTGSSNQNSSSSSTRSGSSTTSNDTESSSSQSGNSQKNYTSSSGGSDDPSIIQDIN